MNSLIQFYYEYFLDENNDGYKLLCSSVCISVTNSLYNKFLKLKEVPPIEEIELKWKQHCWDKACLFYQDKNKRLLASKSAYVLQLISGKYF